MQSKNAIRFVAILLAAACIWQLSFTLVTKIQESKAEKHAQEAVAAFQESQEFAQIDFNDQASALEAIKKQANNEYLDSLSTEKIYFAYTYKDVKAKEINLGLDLKGGMNVMLQVQLENLIKVLVNNPEDETFKAALAAAKEKSVNSRENLITLFGEAWETIAPNDNLARLFGTYEMRGRIDANTTNAQVISIIKEEAESAISNSFNVLRNRIDRFGVTQPNIQKLGGSGKILIELPGVKEPERVRKLLQGTASLEFWATFTCEEILPYLQEADAALAAENVEVVAEKTAAGSSLEEALEAEQANAELATFKKDHPLFAVLSPAVNAQGIPFNTACLGYASYADTAKVNAYLSRPEIKAIFPAEFIPMWTVHPSEYIGGGNYYELVAIKVTTREGKAPLDGGVVTDARSQFSNSGSSEVSMSMNAEGANIWARMTKDNIGRQIAIVLDGMVYSYPTVNGEISGGSSQITGNFTPEEAEDLANVLKSGKLPAPAVIVQEQVVGPSLGSESINAGLISFAIAFALVLIYMICFYSGAGVVADIALLCNVLLLLGSLVSFGAVLTLPGIAGLVLTLGMAVDANVIIYERIKEELLAGKGLSKAIADGYSNAYSAIIDGQLTTILTGLVLFFFGSGPVQGFATTLIIGIITSILTSIFITRIIFDDRIAKGKTIKFENKATRNFLKNTKIDFIGKRKITYVLSSLLVVLSILSISLKGFSYGVDFTGGRTYVVRFDQNVQAEQVRENVLEVFNSAVEVKQFGSDNQMKITTQYKVAEEASEVDAEIEEMLYTALKGLFATDISFDDFRSTLDNPNGIISSDKVGPTIANDIKRDAIIAVVIALFIIFGYIAFRFKGWTWGLGGVVSLAHTAIIVIGFFSFFSGILPFSLDVDQTFIAAVLTIIGYAINDNVVIFDRIREMKVLHPKQDFKVTTNTALNATLSRTMNTSITTLIVMIAIAIFGGEVIRGLAVALIVGIVVGTYASIFIGTPIMFDVTKKTAKK